MIADLLEAGGEMTVDVAPDRQGNWEGLASSATRYNKVPDGKLLKVRRSRSWGQRIITLEDPPAWMTAVLEPIPIAEQLRTPHPVVKVLRDDRSRLPLKREVRARALRILDANAKAAQERGYEVAAPRAESGYRVAKGYLKITINGHSNVLDLTELNDRIPHEPTAKELREKERYSWTRIPDHDQVPSGRLRLSLLQGFAVRQDAFSDTKTINLEDRLPLVLQEVALRAAAAEERDRRLEQEKQERQRRWEEVRGVAKAQVREKHRGETLMSHAERWRLANELDAYLAAMEIRVSRLDGEERAAGEEWLAWSREYRSTRVDPLGLPPRMPDDPDFTPDSLAPFMRGHSPYGPSR